MMEHNLSVSDTQPGRWKLSWTAGLIIFFGFMIRLYAFCNMPVINPDGTFYIQQAKAIYYGLSGSITSCYPYLSNYPFFIWFTYKLFGDWIVAAQLVSLFFGTLTLVPCYLLIRRFCNETVSCLSTLIIALNPTFVSVSVDAMRDPIYWFFSALGLYLFVIQIERKDVLYSALACLCFMMGAWARVEGALFFSMSALYLLVKKQDGRWWRLFFFLLPITFLGLSSIMLFHDTVLKVIEGFALQINDRVLKVVGNYQTLRSNLAHLIDQNPSGFTPYFFPKVRNLIWLIALGAICVKIVMAFFPPFFLPFVLGVSGSKNRILKDSRLVYLSLLSAFSLVLLYVQIIYNWAMTSRFIAVFILPSIVFIGFGLERIISFFNVRLKWKTFTVIALVCMLILLIGVPKNLKSHRKDKIVLREVGEFISNQEGNRSEILMAGAFKRLNVVYFYANLGYKGAPCMQEDARLNPRDRTSLRRLKKKGFDYFIWNEKGWPKYDLERMENEFHDEMVKVREWQSPYLGRVGLFKVKK